jgi:hypothetical protein
MALTPAGEKAKQQIMELMNLIRSECHFYGMSPASVRVNSKLESHVEAVVEALFEAGKESASLPLPSQEEQARYA